MKIVQKYKKCLNLWPRRAKTYKRRFTVSLKMRNKDLKRNKITMMNMIVMKQKLLRKYRR